MLIVVKDGNIQYFFQSFFNFKTAGGADVFQIDAAESGCKVGNCFDDFFRILRIQTDRYCIDASKFFEKYGFSFHNGHGSIGTNVAKA